LGLAAEGMSARAISRRFRRLDRFHLLGNIGFVSDDTEQSALVAQSLARYPNDAGRFAKAFRWSLLGWFIRLPWGIGLATLKACLRIVAGFRQSGVASAGNGAAMRVPIVGTFFRDNAPMRASFTRAAAEVTHIDVRAVEAATFATEVAALSARSTTVEPLPIVEQARRVAREPTLRSALDRAIELARQGATTTQAAAALHTSGFVVHSVPFAAFCFARFGADPLQAIVETIGAGGDTDTNAAMVGAWAGAFRGESALPTSLIDGLAPGPFGPKHLRALANALYETAKGKSSNPVTYSAFIALFRNLALYPVILAHGFRRLLPW
jgi:ADP-ribosyl-[dinitrogen reductase] hydrolase